MKPEKKLTDIAQFLIRKETPPVWGGSKTSTLSERRL